jgi:hypothetical protein
LFSESEARLHFMDFGRADFCERLIEIVGPGTKLFVLASGSIYDARALASIKAAKFPAGVAVHQAHQSELQSVISAIPQVPGPKAVVLLESDPDWLSKLLQAFIDIPVTVYAQTTPRYLCGGGLFVNTIPKAGTHLLSELLQEFGLTRGEGFSGQIAPHIWYFPNNDGPHATAQGFFASVTGQPYGGYFHRLFYTPTLFLYRHPLAVLVSMARYLGERENNSLNHYMQLLPIDRRIDEIIEGPLFVDTFAAWIMRFAAWLILPNVIPISFEELVGPAGDGNEDAQLRLIWSLLLKLHIPGSPSDYCNRIEGRATNTLRIGTIGSFRNYLLDRHIQKLRSFDREFMSRFGYDINDEIPPGYLPRMVEEFRHRPLVCQPMPSENV